jgi:hypothetical protein
VITGHVDPHAVVLADRLRHVSAYPLLPAADRQHGRHPAGRGPLSQPARRAWLELSHSAEALSRAQAQISRELSQARCPARKTRRDAITSARARPCSPGQVRRECLAAQHRTSGGGCGRRRPAASQGTICSASTSNAAARQARGVSPTTADFETYRLKNLAGDTDPAQMDPCPRAVTTSGQLMLPRQLISWRLSAGGCHRAHRRAGPSQPPGRTGTAG